jgi:5-methyltetrahydrofolate--homocysteine methyltransferase
VLDASRAVGVASSLVSDTQKEPLIELTRDDYQKVRDARAGKGQNELATIAEARANAHPFEPSGVAPVPAKPGLHRFDEWPLDDLRQLIDWTPFFRAWELAGNFPPSSMTRSSAKAPAA